MTLTTPTVHVPDTSISVPGWVRRHLTWLLIGVAVLATAVLLALVVVDGGSDADTTPQGGLIERGSINAIEHRSVPAPAPAPAAAPASEANSLLDRSVTAIDRATGTRAG